MELQQDYKRTFAKRTRYVTMLSDFRMIVDRDAVSGKPALSRVQQFATSRAICLRVGKTKDQTNRKRDNSRKKSWRRGPSATNNSQSFKGVALTEDAIARVRWIVSYPSTPLAICLEAYHRSGRRGHGHCSGGCVRRRIAQRKHPLLFRDRRCSIWGRRSRDGLGLRRWRHPIRIERNGR